MGFPFPLFPSFLYSKMYFWYRFFTWNYIKKAKNNGTDHFQGIEMQSVGRSYCFILLSTIWFAMTVTGTPKDWQVTKIKHEIIWNQPIK
jgi:hypothetical protein